MNTIQQITQNIKDNIYQSLENIIDSDDIEIKEVKIELERPNDPIHGDFSSNISLKLSKILNQKPYDIAQKIKEKLKDNKFIEKVEVIEPGFLNFFISKLYLLEILQKVSIEKENYGKSKGDKKRLMVEFAHPNTHKIFHIGHLRNISIGESLVRLLEAVGNEVIRTNYQGD